MKQTLGRIGWLAAGALAMYYFDPQQGAERRRLFVELLQSGARTTASNAAARRQQRARLGAYHRVPRADPASDARLREEIRERLGRLVSHPNAIDVRVENGEVRLSGDVLTKERDGLLLQVQDMPGVQKLVNAMNAHDDPQELASLEARQEAQLTP